MSEQVQAILEVCKHNQTGFCKFGLKCHREHNNELCPVIICRIQNCRRRHPKTCKYHKRKFCKYTKDCAYSHSENKNPNNFEDMKEEVKQLKADIDKLKRNTTKVTQKLFEIQSHEIRNLKQQMENISSNMSEMLIRIVTMETEESNKVDPQHELKCDQCQYKCRKENALIKHINTKYVKNVQHPKNCMWFRMLKL